MPPFKRPERLGQKCLERLGETILDAVAIAELEITDNQHLDEVTRRSGGCWPTFLCLDSIPHVFSTPLFDAIVSSYVVRNRRTCESTAKLLPNPIRASRGHSPAHLPFVLNSLWSPSLSRLLPIIANENLTRMDLSCLGLISYCKMFSSALEEVLTKVPCLTELNLMSRPRAASLPLCTDRHLSILGSHCPRLKVLNISFSRNLASYSLNYLAPNLDRAGCIELERLFIYECGFHFTVVANLVQKLPHLKHLGYPGTGLVLKSLHKRKVPGFCTRLTTLDNRGQTDERQSLSRLSFDKSYVDVANSLAPDLTGIKVRVTDSDLRHLAALSHLTSVELVYDTGVPGSPADGTVQFLQIRGSNLSSVALICNELSLDSIAAIGANCPGLVQLWCRSNVFSSSHPDHSNEVQHSPMYDGHNFFTKLRIFSFRVGHNQCPPVNVPGSVLKSMLKNAMGLQELTVLLNCDLVNDEYIMELLTECRLHQLVKLIIALPGINHGESVLRLTRRTLDFALEFCPGLRTLGYLISWSVTCEELESARLYVCKSNFDIKIIRTA